MTEVAGSLFWYIVTIGLLVTFHEFGHFWVARRCGVKVHRFSIGFGRPLWSRFGRDGTEYVLAAIPLGGYVSMLDERAEDVAPAQLHQALNRKPVWQKIAVAAAGPLANVLLALVVYWAMFMVGKPDFQPVLGQVSGLSAEAGLRTGMRVTAIDGVTTDAWSEVGMAVFEGALYRRDITLSVREPDGDSATHVLRLSGIARDVPDEKIGGLLGLQRHQPALIGQVLPEAAGAKAGLRSGDLIMSVDGEPVTDFDHLRAVLQRQARDGEIALLVEREGERQRLLARPDAVTEDGQTVFRLGIGAGTRHDHVRRYGPLAAMPAALTEASTVTTKSLQFLKDMLLGALSTKHLSGPITIAQVANLSANEGLPWFLGFLGAVSLGLAILNLLPIPILDGGHILYYLIELIKGSPVSERTLVAGQYIGLVMLSGLIGLAFFNDLSGLFR
ncbi:MAG TPA: RIP metalloprotease RseP [Patescibacteria group bacterium]|nr:RIP metalloprotease RseP [Patescibacteria group bacterium]